MVATKINSQVFCCLSVIDSPCCCPSGSTTIFLLEPHFYRFLSASDWHSGGLLQALFPIVYGQLWLEYFPLAWPRPSCTFWDSLCLNSSDPYFTGLRPAHHSLMVLPCVLWLPPLLPLQVLPPTRLRYI